jgi:hypothetical protein
MLFESFELIKDISVKSIQQPTEVDVRNLLYGLHRAQYSCANSTDRSSLHYHAGREVGLVMVLTSPLGQGAQIGRMYDRCFHLIGQDWIKPDPIPTLDHHDIRSLLAHTVVKWRVMLESIKKGDHLQFITGNSDLSVYQEVLTIIGQQDLAEEAQKRALNVYSKDLPKHWERVMEEWR